MAKTDEVKDGLIDLLRYRRTQIGRLAAAMIGAVSMRSDAALNAAENLYDENEARLAREVKARQLRSNGADRPIPGVEPAKKEAS